MNYRNTLETILIVYSCLVLKVTVFFKSLFVPVLFHPLHSDVVLDLKAFLRVFFFQFFQDVSGLQLLLHLLSLFIIAFFEVKFE